MPSSHNARRLAGQYHRRNLQLDTIVNKQLSVQVVVSLSRPANKDVQTEVFSSEDLTTLTIVFPVTPFSISRSSVRSSDLIVAHKTGREKISEYWIKFLGHFDCFA